jgi:hydrogenase maturation protein HypF
MANLEPWRMALAYLYKYISTDLDGIELDFLKSIAPEKLKFIKTALDHNINTPLTSSAGRLFDAVAAMTGTVMESAFHAEAPMRLENLIDRGETGRYNIKIEGLIDPTSIIQGIVHDLTHKVAVQKISAKFHRSIVEIIIQISGRLRNDSGINKVVLSGGTFQNRFILSESEKKLQDAKFQVFTHRHFPSNDGGIALGQLIIAAKRRAVGKLDHLNY